MARHSLPSQVRMRLAEAASRTALGTDLNLMKAWALEQEKRRVAGFCRTQLARHGVVKKSRNASRMGIEATGVRRGASEVGPLKLEEHAQRQLLRSGIPCKVEAYRRRHGLAARGMEGPSATVQQAS